MWFAGFSGVLCGNRFAAIKRVAFAVITFLVITSMGANDIFAGTGLPAS